MLGGPWSSLQGWWDGRPPPSCPIRAFRHSLPVVIGGTVGAIVDRKWLILLAVSLGSFMSTLDGSIVNIALPAIGEDFGLDLQGAGWVVVAYLLVSGSLLLPMGRLGEVLTFKRVYLGGFALFTAASLAGGAAPNAGVLVAARIVQAIGAAGLAAMGPAIVARTFGAQERGRALGLNGVSVSLGLSLGPALGGFLTEAASWRAVFLVNLPVGVLAMLWAGRVLPETERGADPSFDLAGAALSGLTLLALLVALSQGDGWGWTAWPTVVLLISAAGLGGAFVVRERRAAQPLVELALLRIRPFSFGLASVVIAFTGMFTATFLLPWLLERANGLSAAQTGLLLMPVPVSMAIVAPFAGSAADRWGPAIPASTGMALIVLAMLSLTTLPGVLTPWELVPRLVLLGIGQGLFMSPNSSAVMGAVPGKRLGTASGVLAQMRVVGQAIGIAVAAAVVETRLAVHLAGFGSTPSAVDQAAALTASIHDAFVVAALICAAGIVTSLVRGGGHREQSATGEAQPA